MYLDQFFDYKNQFVGDLVKNPSAVHLINDSIRMDDAPSLIYDQIFPYEYLPEVVEDARTFVCCEVDVQSVSNKTYLTPTLYIWVFTHESLMRLPEGGVRTDKLASVIDRMVNGSRFYGLGQINLYSVKRFSPMSKFNGKLMVYDAHEFNKVYDERRPIPVNRKLG